MQVQYILQYLDVIMHILCNIHCIDLVSLLFMYF